MSFESDVKLGERYRDPQTGIQGVATSVAFYQYACERVVLEFLDSQGKLQTEAFDAPRLEPIDQPGKRLRTELTGGPGDDHRHARSFPHR